MTLGLGANVVAALDRVTEVGELVMLLIGAAVIGEQEELDTESRVTGGAVGYRGSVGDPAPLLVPARGLALLDLKLRLAPIPEGIRKDMLDGVDIKLEGELLFLGLVLTSDTGLATDPGAPMVLDEPLLTRKDAGEGGLVAESEGLLLPKSLGLTGLMGGRLDVELDNVEGIDPCPRPSSFTLVKRSLEPYTLLA